MTIESKFAERFGFVPNEDCFLHANMGILSHTASILIQEKWETNNVDVDMLAELSETLWGDYTSLSVSGTTINTDLTTISQEQYDLLAMALIVLERTEDNLRALVTVVTDYSSKVLRQLESMTYDFLTEKTDWVARRLKLYGNASSYNDVISVIVNDYSRDVDIESYVPDRFTVNNFSGAFEAHVMTDKVTRVIVVWETPDAFDVSSGNALSNVISWLKSGGFTVTANTLYGT